MTDGGDLDEKSLLLGVLLGFLIGCALGYVISKASLPPELSASSDSRVLRDGSGRIIGIRGENHG